MFESTVVCGHVALGIQGEHHARKVSFVETGIWKERFGEGTFELLHQRNGDDVPYPCVLTIEDGVPYWYVTNVDTAIAGAGKCELRYIVDEVVIKSCTFITDVIPSLGGASEEPPEPQKAWVDQVLNAAEEVKDAVTHNPIIGDNGNWFVWDADKGEYIDTGVASSGGADIDVPTKLSQLENDEGFITERDLPEVPITSDDWNVTIDGKDFLNMSSEDSMSLSARNSMSLSSECDMSISASSIDVTGDMKVQAPKNDNSAVNKKYVDDAVKDIDIPEVPITTTSDSVTLNGKDFLYIESADSMGFRTRNSMYFESENDMSLRATNINVAGDMTVQDPVNDESVANKKYVDDAVNGIDIPDVKVPTKMSELNNDADYLQNNTDMVITGPHTLEMSSEVVKIEGFYGGSIEIDTEGNVNIAGDAKVQNPVSDTSVANKGYVDGRETAHNTSETAHNDIRQLISGLTSRLNAVANSDDTTLDQLSEIVAYIKANKSLIDSITTSKVNVSDIIDNLTTSVSNKPLSAKMGVELKKLIDAIKIPTTLPASDVYSWAKQPTKPTYTAAEVGAATPAYVDNKVNEIIKSAESIPDYWLSELETKADAIQQAMEKAGRNKSAFLWYTDAHWVNGNSKMSPALLDYLYRNTPMNKVNFGGDIIGDSLLASREEMKYLYEWREAIKDLPNHHSVLGNHDMFASDSVDYEDDNYRYAIMIAPEESSDMVMGEGNYYYIDNPCEKTRYLHFAYLTSGHTAMMAQGQFMVDAIKGVPEGWHIVAIAHRWWQYSSASTPTTGSIPAFETEMLSVFDAYNARTTRSGSNYFTAQDFASAKGRVEFCIAGHIHVDYDFETEGGIPVIVTTADTNQNRVPDSTVDSGTVGTTTEAAVFGIIADYNDTDNTKITVVGVGRGTSRVVRKSSVKLTSISDITYSGDTTVGAAIDASKFSFKANYSNGTTDTVNGATSVSPATVGIVGNNTVTITYTEGTVSVSGTMTLVGTPVPVVNLFNKDDTDIAIGHRIRSSGETQYQAEGQLVTGWIEVKAGDTIVITSDKACNTNSYTGTICCYGTDKVKLGSLGTSNTTQVTISADALTETIVIPTGTLNTSDYSGTTYMRCCIAYTDIDSIVITKS